MTNLEFYLRVLLLAKNHNCEKLEEHTLKKIEQIERQVYRHSHIPLNLTKLIEIINKLDKNNFNLEKLIEQNVVLKCKNWKEWETLIFMLQLKKSCFINEKNFPYHGFGTCYVLNNGGWGYASFFEKEGYKIIEWGIYTK